MESQGKRTPAAEEPLTEATEAEESDGASLLELVLEEHDSQAAPTPVAPSRIDGVVVGILAAVEPSGTLLVKYPGGPDAGLVARPFAPITAEDVGREVALLFEGGDPSKPIVMGKMHGQSTPRAVQADGERLEFRADKEIVLSCGKASITLTRAGKILIRGAYVLSRSSGVHRIQGGSVQIN